VRNISEETNSIRTTRRKSEIFKNVNGKEGRFRKIDNKEIISFLDSLNEEKEQFKISNEEVLESELMICEKVEGKIAGIAGIRRRFGVPLFLIVVKSEFQGKHIGSSLMERLNEIIREKYSYLVLTVSKNNEHALYLYKKFGYKKLGEIPEAYYMFCPLTKRGQIFFWILKFGFPLILIIRRLVLAIRELKTKTEVII
jgi:ribosomal protein S18 acetylase RimI-like enzyme